MSGNHKRKRRDMYLRWYWKSTNALFHLILKLNIKAYPYYNEETYFTSRSAIVDFTERRYEDLKRKNQTTKKRSR